MRLPPRKRDLHQGRSCGGNVVGDAWKHVNGGKVEVQVGEQDHESAKDHMADIKQAVVVAANPVDTCRPENEEPQHGKGSC